MLGKTLQIFVLGAAAFDFSLLASSAKADVLNVDLGFNPTYVQTSPTTVTSTGGFTSFRAFLSTAGQFNTGTLSGPAGFTTTTLTPDASGTVLAGGSSYASTAALAAANPTGTYTFNLGNTSTAATFSTSINYMTSAPSNAAQVTAASYNALQGLNAGQGVTVDFNTMVPSPDANDSEIFVNIYDSTGNAVFQSSLPDSATSVFIPAGTLLSGEDYTFDLLFDDRINGQTADGIPDPIFFDSHTAIAFSTAVAPLPASWALLLAGFAGLGLVARRGRKEADAPFVM